MGIKDFSAALGDTAYRQWLNNLTPNVVRQSTRELREQLESDPTRNNFLITDTKIKDMAAYVTGLTSAEISDQQVLSIKQKMLDSLKRVKNAGKQYSVKEYPEKDAIVVENINFQTMETMLEAGFGKGRIDGWKRSIGSGYHRGHVLGLPTVLLNETIRQLELGKRKVLKKDGTLTDEDIPEVTRIPEETRKLLIQILKDYRQNLQKQDYSSSNLGSSDYEIYAQYTKDSDNFLIEMQIGGINTASGREAGKTVSEMRQFLDPGKMNAGILKKIVTTITQPSVILKYINTPGSPKFTELLTNKLANIMDNTGFVHNVKKTTIPKVKVAEKKIKVKRSPNDRKKYSNELRKVNTFIKELEAIPNRRKQIAKIGISVSSLQNLINAQLFEAIKNNMGTGNRKDVLNYRTGRFARSVKIEKVSESRQGMITAFYSYMKNPYATFSSGGRQELPRSRDPKLLISKSIREIAQGLVSNRLRAVNV